MTIFLFLINAFRNKDYNLSLNKKKENQMNVSALS